jgi:N-terminal domain of ribose phosphate pyrophosphokinase
MMTDGFAILCGNANRTLAAKVADAAGVALSDALVERFPDGEVNVETRASVRDKDVFIIQSTAPPVNDHLMELLATVDACRRASAARIFAVIPYFGYARSDKRHGRREPISARLVADLLQPADKEKPWRFHLRQRGTRQVRATAPRHHGAHDGCALSSSDECGRGFGCGCFTTLSRLDCFARSLALTFRWLRAICSHHAAAALRRRACRVRAAFRAASRRSPGPLVRTALRAAALRADADRRRAALLA